jgi:predicted Fe-Mo cluster-binding NifX family protein
MIRGNIGVCQLNDRVAPRLDQCPELLLVTAEVPGAVKEKRVFPIATLKPREMADLLERLQVKTLICGGVREDYQQALKKLDIQLIDNVIGDVEDVLARYFKGKLNRGNTEGLHPQTP